MKKKSATLLARFAVFVVLLFLNSPEAGSLAKDISGEWQQQQKVNAPKILNAGFVCVEKVYNSELMAPYDVLQHSLFRDATNYIRCFIVTPDGKPFVTFEGIRITPDYAFANAPPIDILVIPSTETSMTADLANESFNASSQLNCRAEMAEGVEA
jgi:transcriptional regulator GlxA family with amidase domain